MKYDKMTFKHPERKKKKKMAKCISPSQPAWTAQADLGRYFLQIP